MGLSIHIHACAPASLGREEAAALVSRWHAVAETLAAAGRVDRVFETSDDAADLDQFAAAWLSFSDPADPETAIGTTVSPLEGRIFLVQFGPGCEPLALGLCRYPATVSVSSNGTAPLSTGKTADWQLLTSCKTQYASRHGWEAFYRCHIAVVELAAAGIPLGVNVRIEDEGGYWPDRNETTLRAALLRLNRLTAGLAGALKDAADEDNTGISSVEAPILEHPDFERLEAEAHTGADAQKIADALRLLRDDQPRKNP